MSQDFLAGFDASKIDPSSMGEVWPLDWYKVVITDIEEKINSNENGTYLQFSIKCIDGAYAGRECVFNLNVRHPNQQVADISFKQISAICRCVGVLQLQARQQLYNIPFKIRIGPQKNNEIYSNAVGFQDINGNPPNKAGQAPVQPVATPGAYNPPQAPHGPAFAPAPAAAPAQWGPPPTAPAAAPVQPAWGPPPPPAAPAPAQPPAAPAWGNLPPAPWGPPK